MYAIDNCETCETCARYDDADAGTNDDDAIVCPDCGRIVDQKSWPNLTTAWEPCDQLSQETMDKLASFDAEYDDDGEYADGGS